MKRFEIDKMDGKIQSVSRTVRLKAELFDRLMLPSEESGVLSRVFRKLVSGRMKSAGKDVLAGNGI